MSRPHRGSSSSWLPSPVSPGVGVRHSGRVSAGAAGPREDTAAAMEQAGAAFSWLDRREIAARIPFAAPPWEHGVLDPLGGSLRIRRALAALARRVDIHRAEVASVAGDGSVTLADGTVMRGDLV